MSRKLIIAGIGTDVGKTIVSSIVAESLKACYWKPVQAGDLDNSDSKKVANYTSNVEVLKERFCLTEPMSPHAAARIDNVVMEIHDFEIPSVDRNLIIEGAGGLMVPINDEGLTYLDIFEKWGIPLILVSRHYLGSINHTLMSIDILKSRNIPVEGIIFVGDENKETESIILNTSGLKMIARIPIAKTITKEFIQEQATKIKID